MMVFKVVIIMLQERRPFSSVAFTSPKSGPRCVHMHIDIGGPTQTTSPVVAAGAASSTVISVVVFKETTNSVNTVKDRLNEAGLCSPLRGGALIAAPHKST